MESKIFKNWLKRKEEEPDNQEQLLQLQEKLAHIDSNIQNVESFMSSDRHRDDASRLDTLSEQKAEVVAQISQLESKLNNNNIEIE